MLDEQPEDQDSPAPKVIDAPLHIWCDVLYVRADDVVRQIAEALKKESKSKLGHNEVSAAMAHMKRMESALKALQSQARIRAAGNLDNKAPT